MTIRLLRLRRPSDLLTAQVYEELFDRELGRHFDVRVADSAAFCTALFGDTASAVDAAGAQPAAFRHATAAVDFVCPNFECAPLAPALVALRNASAAPVRLLFISHATGSYAAEWSLLAPLLRAGDVIVTPSHDARRIALALHPALAPFIVVIHHPMAPLPPVAVTRARASRRPHLASLGRVHAHKLIHRQVEAVAILRERGRVLPTLDIGGPLDDAGWHGAHPYTRALQHKIARLGLDGAVRLVGAVRGASAKAAFLANADLLCNLSVTIEESFPKSPVEALGLGVPVLGTAWTGLRETVGACGHLIPVTLQHGVMGGADVDAVTVANAIELLLETRPDPEQCRTHVSQFAPERMLAWYDRALTDALDRRATATPGDDVLPGFDVGAAPDTGLLATAAPLTGMAWREWFDAYTAWTYRLRRAWAGELPSEPSWADDIRRLLAVSVQPGLELVASGADHGGVDDVAASRPTVRATSPEVVHATAPPDVSALHRAVLAPATSDAGRVAAAAALLSRGDTRLMTTALDQSHVSERERRYWEAEQLLASREPMAALAQALAAVRHHALSEDDWTYVRLVSRAARRGGIPSAAVATLRRWLQSYPDSQESGAVWLELAVCLTRAGGFAEADVALAEARTLLGDIPSIAKCAANIAVASRHEALAT